LRALGRTTDALASYRRAIAVAPADAATYTTLGIALYDLRQLYESVASYDRAIAIKQDPRNAAAV
jgi:tetratricopeptide (TPR) repeat protein